MDFPFESDPRFAQLDYEAQTRLRAKAALKTLSADPRFQKLDAEGQQRVLSSVSIKPPVFITRNPTLVKQAQEYFEAYKQGKLAGIKAQAFAGATAQNNLLLSAASRLAGELDPKLGFVKELATGPDGRKMQQYLSALGGGTASAVGSLFGFVFELASMKGAGGFGAVKVPFTGGRVVVGKSLQGMAKTGVSNMEELVLKGVVRNAPVFSKWLVGDAAPAALRLINAGIQGVGREALLERLRGEDVNASVGKITQTFGEYAGLNSAFWITVNVALPFLSLAGRVLKGIKKVDPLLTRTVVDANGVKKNVPLTAEEFTRYRESYAQGNLPPEVFNTLSPEAQDVFEANKQFDFFKANPEVALSDPYGRAVLAGQGMGKLVVRVPGGYRIRDIIERAQSVTVETLDELDNAMAMLLKTELKRMDEAAIAALRGDKLKNYLFSIIERDTEIQKVLAKARPADASKGYTSMTKRLFVSPLEAEHLNVTTADDVTVDTFSMPMSKTTEGVLEHLKPQAQSRMLRGTPSMRLTKDETPNVLAVFTRTAPVEETALAKTWAERAIANGSRESVNALIPVGLRRLGYDSARMPDGSILALFPERLRVLDNKVNPKTGKMAKQALSLKTPEKVNVEVFAARAQVPDTEVAGSNTLLASLVDTMGDAPDRQRIGRFAELAARRMGLGNMRVRVTMLDDVKGVEVQGTEYGLRLVVPRERGRWGGSGPYSTKILKAIDQYVRTRPEKGTMPRDYRVENLAQNAENIGKWFVEKAKSDPAIARWLGRESLTAPRDPRTWASIAKKFMASQETSAELKVQLAEMGVRLIDRGPELVAVKDGKVLGSGADVAGLLENMQWSPPRMSSRFGPRVASIDPDGVTFNVANTQVIGEPQQVFQFLDHFEDIAAKAASRELFASETGRVVMYPKAGFEVSIPSFGLKQVFATAEEARAYLNGGYREWGSLVDQVETKGGVLRFVDGKFRVYMGRTIHEADTVEEMGKVLARFPDPAMRPEIVAEDVSVYFREKNPLIGWNATRPRYTPAPPPPEKPAFLAKASMMLKPMTPWVTDFATKVGDTETLRAYTDVEYTARVATRETDMGHAIIDRMQNEVTKRFSFKWTETKQSAFYYWMEAADDERRTRIATAFGLKSAEVEAFTVLKEQMRAFMGEAPDAPGSLFRKFGVDPRRFLWEYMSRVRDRMDTMSIEELNTEEVISDEILKKIFAKDGQGIPRELEAWFTNQRTSDVAAWALDTNFSRVMKKYITRGNLALYVDEPWRKLRGAISREGVDPALRWRVYRYMDVLQGGAQTDGEKLMANFAHDFMKRLGVEESKARVLSKDSMKALYSISYATNLGWRPYSAIRNLAQSFQTAGVMLGHSYVIKAMNELAGDSKGEYVRYLKQMGVIHDAPPIVNSILDSEKALGKVTNSSMNMFTSADEWSRALAYKAAELAWEDAAAAFPRVSAANAKRFSENLKANFFGPEIEGRVIAAAVSGDMRTAKHLYAYQMQEVSMFLMRREQAPVFFHGFFGKMLGQFGNFSTSYAAFVTRAAKYGTASQKAAFYGRWLATGAAFAAAAYGAGLRWQDWMPWAPAQFAGGPLFNTMINAMQAVGSNYRGRQARGELNSMLPVDLNKLYWKVREGPLASTPLGSEESEKSKGSVLQMPRRFMGYYQLKSAMDIVKYMEEGNPLFAFYALTSAPIRSDLR